MTITTILESLCGQEGFEIGPEMAGRFETYYRMLHERNKVMNLVADTDPAVIGERHILDSLNIFKAGLAPNSKVADIGSGAGFPGIPLKIYCPSLDMTLVDSLGKRVTFLNDVISELGMDKFTAIQARAEEMGQDRLHRGAYDYVCSRAVARLNILVELCVPLLKVGGTFYAMKSTHIDAEIEDSREAIRLMGAELESDFQYMLAGAIPMRLLRIKKTAKTPSIFPRRYSKIKQEPL